MNRMLTLLSAFFLFAALRAQPANPVVWSATYKAVSEKEGEIIITGKLENGWHTYSQRPTDAGPIPTSFTFTPSKDYKLKGKTEETGAHEEFVKAFDAKIYVFTGTAEFHQKVTAARKGILIPVKIEYMCCNDMMCLPPKTADLQVRVQ
jgi:DsbC/DsbD-like thiol-disulfide interchange protein